MKEIKIQYDGDYPNLCSGHLIVTIGEDIYDFGSHCISSGGGVWFSADYGEEHADEGAWSVSNWPKGFPEEYKEFVLDKINDEIPHGCCGGCI